MDKHEKQALAWEMASEEKPISEIAATLTVTEKTALSYIKAHQRRIEKKFNKTCAKMGCENPAVIRWRARWWCRDCAMTETPEAAERTAAGILLKNCAGYAQRCVESGE